ncbi:cyclic nucleotide-binding domain-containing protein [Neosynechococcus sphagnicola]|uniref:cyclic nucleotide-binding domain-containing protein n=1 Tax=Neosynechococcus sphagnicola TaxID=1501145 RepID=UPI000689E6FC|nr:cyclic nucleotide-binding domain-containing protein [Neosynechococcus sphagnicola]
MEKGQFILSVLSEADIGWMRRVGKVEEIPAGTVLIQGGQPLDWFYIILSGHLTVFITAPEKKEIATIGVGEILGEMSFVDASLPSATVAALEDSLVLAISQQQLAAQFELDHSFAHRFYRAIALFLSSRLRRVIGQLGYD